MNACRRALRLIVIMTLLEDCVYSCTELAIVLHVSRQTIRKDLRDLQGEPLYFPLMYSRDGWRKMR
jgi:DeoR/GlpR family transcriptional regulator of sugar metabolism